MKQRRYIIVPFPAQGHINPCLQFSKRLIGTGAEVVFVTSISVHRRIMKNKTSTSTPDGLSFFLYSDGFDDGFKPRGDPHRYLSELRRGSKQAVSDLVNSGAKHGCPFTCVFYSLCVQWIAETTRELHVPSALLWIEPATVFGIYYYFFHGYEDEIKNNMNDPSYSIELPGLPLKLTGRDLPTFMDATKSENNETFQLNMFREQFDVLDKETKIPRVLVNSFDVLEPEAFISISDDQVKLFGIGPLIQSTFSGEEDHEDQSETSFRDQGTNAKLIEDVWKTGLRVKANKEGIVERDEIKRCLELVMGDDDIGRNTKKWKDLGRDALKAGGTFDKNFKAFLDEIDQEKGHFVD
ncbi:hypothetical protein FEM48_Zijuj07G0046400 [Ziziphus jujuba var. spinosa]|uniref:Glycosyltransferase N-terminal domain-containing protein n=1 Tax=Ziziphus jujuba var. spinosa TaxID=714518 RepID=A0A978V2H7_ZIZJJ|nr:hypothetical protein FEM48_Zijuj07G0046400 [Ziziphus jujuba var. spinosa]